MIPRRGKNYIRRKGRRVCGGVARRSGKRDLSPSRKIANDDHIGKSVGYIQEKGSKA